MYVPVGVWMPADDDIDEPFFRVFTYPFKTREEAEREAEQFEEITDADDTPDAEWCYTTTKKLLVPDQDYDRMDASTFEALENAAGAVGQAIVSNELHEIQ